MRSVTRPGRFLQSQGGAIIPDGVAVSSCATATSFGQVIQRHVCRYRLAVPPRWGFAEEVGREALAVCLAAPRRRVEEAQLNPDDARLHDVKLRQLESRGSN